MSDSLRSWMLSALLSHGQEQEETIALAQAARGGDMQRKPSGGSSAAGMLRQSSYLVMSLEDAPYRGGAKVQLLQLLTVEEYPPLPPATVHQKQQNGKRNARKVAQSAALALVADKTHFGIVWLSPDAMRKYYVHHEQKLCSMRGAILNLRKVRPGMIPLPPPPSHARKTTGPFAGNVPQPTTTRELPRVQDLRLGLEVESFDVLGSIGEAPFAETKDLHEAALLDARAGQEMEGQNVLRSWYRHAQADLSRWLANAKAKEAEKSRKRLEKANRMDVDLPALPAPVETTTIASTAHPTAPPPAQRVPTPPAAQTSKDKKKKQKTRPPDDSQLGWGDFDLMEADANLAVIRAQEARRTESQATEEASASQSTSFEAPTADAANFNATLAPAPPQSSLAPPSSASVPGRGAGKATSSHLWSQLSPQDSSSFLAAATALSAEGKLPAASGSSISTPARAAAALSSARTPAALPGASQQSTTTSPSPAEPRMERVGARARPSTSMFVPLSPISATGTEASSSPASPSAPRAAVATTFDAEADPSANTGGAGESSRGQMPSLNRGSAQDDSTLPFLLSGESGSQEDQLESIASPSVSTGAAVQTAAEAGSCADSAAASLDNVQGQKEQETKRRDKGKRVLALATPEPEADKDRAKVASTSSNIVEKKKDQATLPGLGQATVKALEYLFDQSGAQSSTAQLPGSSTQSPKESTNVSQATPALAPVPVVPTKIVGAPASNNPAAKMVIAPTSQSAAAKPMAAPVSSAPPAKAVVAPSHASVPASKAAAAPAGNVPRASPAPAAAATVQVTMPATASPAAAAPSAVAKQTVSITSQPAATARASNVAPDGARASTSSPVSALAKAPPTSSAAGVTAMQRTVPAPSPYAPSAQELRQAALASISARTAVSTPSKSGNGVSAPAGIRNSALAPAPIPSTVTLAAATKPGTPTAPQASPRTSNNAPIGSRTRSNDPAPPAASPAPAYPAPAYGIMAFLNSINAFDDLAPSSERQARSARSLQQEQARVAPQAQPVSAAQLPAEARGDGQTVYPSTIDTPGQAQKRPRSSEDPCVGPSSASSKVAKPTHAATPRSVLATGAGSTSSRGGTPLSGRANTTTPVYSRSASVVSSRMGDGGGRMRLKLNPATATATAAQRAREKEEAKSKIQALMMQIED